MDVSMPPYVIVVMLKSCYFPLKDITGEFSCYVIHVFEVVTAMTMQCHTFFVTLFRYICIFHDNKIIHMRMTAKVLSKLL